MTEAGIVRISNEVVGVISSVAAMEIEGVFGMSGGAVDGLSEILGKKSPSKGVKVELGEEECAIDVFIIVDYGVRIPDVSRAVQKNVSKAVAGMTGYKVIEVNVFVQSVHLPETENAETDDKKKERIIK